MSIKANKAANVSGGNGEDRAYFRLRIHDNLLDRVRAEAEKNFRSMTAEIACIIAQHFEALDARKKKRT